jgi:hypothetical protein
MRQLQGQSRQQTAKKDTTEPVGIDHANVLRDDAEVDDGDVEKTMDSDRKSKD